MVLNFKKLLQCGAPAEEGARVGRRAVGSVGTGPCELPLELRGLHDDSPAPALAPSCPSGTSFSFFMTLAFLLLHRGVKPVLLSQVSHLF